MDGVKRKGKIVWLLAGAERPAQGSSYTIVKRIRLGQFTNLVSILPLESSLFCKFHE